MTNQFVEDARFSMSDATFDRWMTALEARHLSNLTVSEVTRALRALSSGYVERRDRLADRSALDGAGKRAAYAMYYSPLHFLAVRAIGAELNLAARPVRRLADLGCGAGAAGAAWGSLVGSASVLAIDTIPWALAEAAFTYATFALDASTRRGDAARLTLPRSADAIVAGWLVNELDESSRDALLTRLLRAAEQGVAVLIVEPIATRVSPWWSDWAPRFVDAGGRADEWRFRLTLPELCRRLGSAAGLRQDALTARSIYAAR